jgi:prolyl-tRNA synthetase
MKDAYSFDLTKENLDLSYKNMKEAYVKIFDRLGLDYRVVKADTGEIGGSDSEEIHVLADTGEDLLVFSNESDFASNVELMLEEGQDPQSLKGKLSPDGKGTLELKKGIEVGHIFKLGTKYSESMNFKIQVENENKFLEMGCYGIGISRIVAAAIEQNNDEKGIIWPEALAPFNVCIIEVNPKNDQKVSNQCEELYKELSNQGFDVLWDNRDQGPGVKFSDMELIGIPNIVTISKKTIENNHFEFRTREEEQGVHLSLNELLTKIKG